MSAFFEVAFRIAYYQMIVIMVLMPWIFRQSKKNNGRRICMSIYVLLFFTFIMWNVSMVLLTLFLINLL